MAILSANVANLFDARINKAFYMNLNMWESEKDIWCEVLTSKDQYEKVTMYGELAMPAVVGEYEESPEQVFKEGPVRTWTHVKYGGTIIASEECLEDERFPVVEQSASAFGRAMRHRIENQGAYDLNNSFTVSTVGPSNTASETLCATSHATFTGAGGSAQANRPSTDVTLGADSLWAGVNNFSSLKDRENNPVRVIPTMIVAPPALERVCIELLKSIEVPYKSTNEINAIRTRGLDYRLGHYLSSTTAWWIIGDQKPVRFYMRRSPTVKPEETIRTDSRYWVITCRLSHGPYDWYQIYGTDGTP